MAATLVLGKDHPAGLADRLAGVLGMPEVDGADRRSTGFGHDLEGPRSLRDRGQAALVDALDLLLRPRSAELGHDARVGFEGLGQPRVVSRVGHKFHAQVSVAGREPWSSAAAAGRTRRARVALRHARLEAEAAGHARL